MIQAKLAATLLFAAISINVQKINAQQKGDFKKPNVIIILTDDQGYADVGFNGCTEIPTPNIDAIARRGVRFTNGYVSFSVCSPSRAGLLTGRYQSRFGYDRNPLYVADDEKMGLPLKEQTLANMLEPANYKSMIIGKWHLGAHPSLHPLKRGFTDFYGFLGGGHRYMPGEWTIQNGAEAGDEGESYRTKLVRNYTVVEEKEYLTDALSREAESFIGKNKQQPFLLYLAYNAPHNPLQATQKYLDRFAHINDPKRKTYAAMVSAVDDGVGRVMNALYRNGLEKNTMVFFLSDNGGPEEDNGSDNGVLRGGKGSLFEGGIRVPFAMQWIGHVPENTVYTKPVISLDIFATAIANIDGAAKPANKIDGVNLLPYLNQTISSAPHDWLFWRHFDKNTFAVVSAGNKKLLKQKEASLLYDLQKDIGESKPLGDAEKDLPDSMNKKSMQWSSELQPPAFWGLMHKKEYDLERSKKNN